MKNALAPEIRDRDDARIPYTRIIDLYNHPKGTSVKNYSRFLSSLQGGDVVLYTHPPLLSVFKRGWSYPKARIYLHALIHNICLRSNPHKGTYEHAEWAIGWLRKDNLLFRVINETSPEHRKRLFSKEYLSFIKDCLNDPEEFADRTLEYLSRGDHHLSPGISHSKLSLSQVDNDVLLTVGLKRMSGVLHPVLKMFSGNPIRPAIWGPANRTTGCPGLSDYFVDHVIKGTPVVSEDPRALVNLNRTPVWLPFPAQFFAAHNPGPCIVYTLFAVHLALRTACERGAISEQQIERFQGCTNNLSTPIPRNSFYLFFEKSFESVYRMS